MWEHHLFELKKKKNTRSYSWYQAVGGRAAEATSDSIYQRPAADGGGSKHLERSETCQFLRP